MTTTRTSLLRPEDCLTSAELAARRGVVEATVRTWRKRGLGPVFYKFGASVVYLRDDVEAWEATQEADAS